MAVGGAAGGPCVALPVNSTEVDWNAVKRVLARIGEGGIDEFARVLPDLTKPAR